MQHNSIQKLFKPESIALFGASNAPGKLGTVVLRNLKSAGYGGSLTLEPEPTGTCFVLALPLHSDTLVVAG